MVKRGSTVRVRQRASNKDLQTGSFTFEAFHEAEAPGQWIVDTYVHGGAISSLDAGDTRARRPVDALHGGGDGVLGRPRCETSREIGEFGAGTYLNFTGLAEEDAAAGVADAFGPNLQRLAEMKLKYDPDKFFRRINNVMPAG